MCMYQVYIGISLLFLDVGRETVLLQYCGAPATLLHAQYRDLDGMRA